MGFLDLEAVSRRCKSWWGGGYRDPSLRMKGGRWGSYPGPSANDACRPQLPGSRAAARTALPPDPLLDAFPSPGSAHGEAVTWGGDDTKSLSLDPGLKVTRERRKGAARRRRRGPGGVESGNTIREREAVIRGRGSARPQGQ